MISKKQSFKGFKISKNLKSALIESGFVLLPAIIAELVSNNIISTVAAGLIGAVISKTYKFYKKEVEVL
jgi:hypothetical protein